MNKKYLVSLFIFRRDLRLHDNTALNQALEQSEMVIPCFILTPEQIGPKNEYRSLRAIEFMMQSIDELNKELMSKSSHLYIFYGKPEGVVAELLYTQKPGAVFVNTDYTPYSKQRDSKLQKLCGEHGVDFLSFHDTLLHAPGEIVNLSGKPYEIFTPFFKKSSQVLVANPATMSRGSYFSKKLPQEITNTSLKELLPKTSALYSNGGRKNGLSIIKHANDFKNYATTHDYPAYDTSLLGPHNKFGTVSIREVYHGFVQALSEHHPLVRQLYWRDFFYHIAWHYPSVFGHAFHKKFDELPWSTNKNHFQRWCEGTTGFPIVDAGMRQLNQTGFMHNRVRLITGSFLVKDLHINWQWGEKYFAQMLTDYDPCVNNGNWQWVASTGCDHQPYFRIFNPWLQQKKFDPECIYIKRYIPELRDISPKLIHTWYKQTKPIERYPSPIIDHGKEASIAKAIYAKFVARKS